MYEDFVQIFKRNLWVVILFTLDMLVLFAPLIIAVNTKQPDLYYLTVITIPLSYTIYKWFGLHEL